MDPISATVGGALGSLLENDGGGERPGHGRNAMSRAAGWRRGVADADEDA
jgi:hypothetical protein